MSRRGRFPVFFAAMLLAGGPWGAAAQSGGPATVTVDYSNPGLTPAHWTLELHRDGRGYFRADGAKPHTTGVERLEAGAVDREIQLKPEFAGRLFAAAERHRFFNVACESRLKVAFQGFKTLSYSGPDGKGSCTFNYSTDKEIQALGDALTAVATTLLEGARLEMLLQHDRLGLDQETQFLAEAVRDGRAQQVGAIREILERLAQDESVLERVRKRARQLLERDS